MNIMGKNEDKNLPREGMVDKCLLFGMLWSYVKFRKQMIKASSESFL